MIKNYLKILITFLLLFSSSLMALHRDYHLSFDQSNFYYPYCLKHTPGNYRDWVPGQLANLIPITGSACLTCNQTSIYPGYLDPVFQQYSIHLIHQLNYTKKNPTCHCYWPEYSPQAAIINDQAYLLFRNLIRTTALANLITDEAAQRTFAGNFNYIFNEHGVTLCFVSKQFRFSDYYHIYKDLKVYADQHYSLVDSEKIIDRLEDILEILYRQFLPLYQSCYAKHPHKVIAQEIQLMKLLVNDPSGLEKSLTVKDCQIALADNSSTINNLFIDPSPSINLSTTDLPTEKDPGISILESSGQHLSTCVENSLLQHVRGLGNSLDTFSTPAEILLEKGTVLNNCMLYKSAIEVLTEAIKLNPHNPNAYLERALAHFERGETKLALEDYKKSKLKNSYFSREFIRDPSLPFASKDFYLSRNRKDFTKGLLKGILKGSKESTQNFLPSLLSSLRGTAHGLWAFVLNPQEVSQEMAKVFYGMGEYIKHHTAQECLECVVPELEKLSQNWDHLDDYQKGKKIGYIIGKYGVDIFLPVGLIKGVAKVRTFKRANTALTLETCLSSSKNKAKILKESANIATVRASIIDQFVKNGKILIKDANKQAHIMQKKHAWDKLIKLSGNIEEDCKNVVKLLEEHKIFALKYRIKTEEPFKGCMVYTHVIKIKEYEVKAMFYGSLEESEKYLSNAWVVVK